MKYYLTELIFRNESRFALWFTDDKDGFVCEKYRIVSFDSRCNAEKYAHENGIVLCGDSEVKCFADDLSDHSAVIDLWNTAADAAVSVGEYFSGSEKDKNELYNKLFSACDIPAMEQKAAAIQLTVHETGELAYIIKEAEKLINFAVSSVSLPDYLFPVVYSRYFDHDRAMDIIYSLIESSDKPADWLIDASLCSDRDELIKVIIPYRQGMPEDPMDSALGFYYLLYSEGRESLKDMLMKCGNFCDAYGPIDCGVFYDMVNRLEDGSDELSIADEFAKLCTDEIAQAKKYLGVLNGYINK